MKTIFLMRLMTVCFALMAGVGLQGAFAHGTGHGGGVGVGAGTAPIQVAPRYPAVPHVNQPPVVIVSPPPVIYCTPPAVGQQSSSFVIN